MPDLKFSKLCEICAVCLEHLWEDRDRVIIEFHPHHTVEQLKENASWGCEFCKAIMATMRLQSPFFDQHGKVHIQICLPSARAWSSYRFIHLNWRPHGSWKNIPVLGVEDANKYELTQVFLPFSESEVAGLSLPDASIFGERTDSRFCQSLAIRWLENCLLHHQHCAPKGEATGRSSHWIPTRLLEIQQQSATERIVRLVVRDRTAAGPFEPYVTLSHCWGNSQTRELLESNFQEYADGILVSDLPWTYRDAVEICGWLKVKYIWIDSLCIVQHCKDDWVRESVQMHLVYSNAMLNIAASGAHNSEAGCFRGRDPGLRVPAKLHLSRGSVVLIPTPDILAATVTDGALAQRAWVLQEQLLARRVLYFGEQLFWECAENWACETLPDGPTDMLTLLGDPYYLSIKRRIKGLILSPNINWTPWASQYFLYDTWDIVCREYSRRILTRKSDKAIALSGIVKYFKPLFSPDEYAAGLWKKDLMPGLLWYIQPPGNTKDVQSPGDPKDIQLSGNPKDIQSPGDPKVDEYRAPSWSWLSLDGEVVYASKHRRNGFEVQRVENVSINTATGDETCLFREGCGISLFGVLRPAHLRHIELSGDNFFELSFDGKVAISSKALEAGTARSMIRPDFVCGLPLGNIFLLPLIISFDEDKRRIVLHGVMLDRFSPADGGGLYRRIGYFETTAFRRLFYKIRSTAHPVSGNGNPWIYLEKYSKAFEEDTDDNNYMNLDSKGQNGDKIRNCISLSELRSLLGPYPDFLFEPLHGQSITII